jgi:hypothetical protein
MSNQQRPDAALGVSMRLCSGVTVPLGMLLAVCLSAFGQSKAPPSRGVYTSARLAFRFTPPNAVHDKTARFPALQIHNSLAGTPQALSTLLGRVARAFDLAGISQRCGCPALAFFARAGVGNACTEWV